MRVPVPADELFAPYPLVPPVIVPVTVTVPFPEFNTPTEVELFEPVTFPVMFIAPAAVLLAPFVPLLLLLDAVTFPVMFIVPDELLETALALVL